RYFADAGLDYRVISSDDPQLGRALVGFRTIELRPTVHRVTKIVDLYGDSPAAEALTLLVCDEARRAGHVYVDFWSFGGPYADMLHRLGFVSLTGDDVAVLPT